MVYQPIFYIIGIFLCVLAGFMTIPMITDLYYGNPDWIIFVETIGITSFFGILFILSNKNETLNISGKQAFVLTAFSWIFLCLFAALPLYFGVPDMSFTNALFESVSGLTTTGATVIMDVESLSHGVLMWRALLQFLGGVGIIVMAISILPFLKVGGMQLFRLESSEKEKIVPRATQLAAYIVGVQFVLTTLCTLGYGLAGMSWFDAIAHAMTTTSTGGFSTKNTSFGEYQTYYPELVSIVFMIAGSLPLVMYIKMINGNIKAIPNDQQSMGFLKTALILCFIMVGYLTWQTSSITMDSLIKGIFTTISFLTGTGYVDTNYSEWGGFTIGFFMFISFIGGCAGSATGGVKIFRFQIFWTITKNQLLQLIYPNGVFPIDYNKHPVSVQVAASVMAFFFIFVMTCIVVCLALMLFGLDFVTALSATAATVANVGAGVGNIVGPTGNFSLLPENTQWIMIAGMLLGRLEFFTLLVFFVPRFWKW